MHPLLPTWFNKRSPTTFQTASGLTLYTMEMAPMDANDDYLSLMNKNLDNLKAGLGC